MAFQTKNFKWVKKNQFQMRIYQSKEVTALWNDSEKWQPTWCERISTHQTIHKGWSDTQVLSCNTHRTQQ